MPELIDVIIEEKAALFVAAVGVPEKWVVDKLHAAGIIVMNVCRRFYITPGFFLLTSLKRRSSVTQNTSPKPSQSVSTLFARKVSSVFLR